MVESTDIENLGILIRDKLKLPEAMNEQELRQFRSRFGIPISDEEIDTLPFFKPAEDSVEMQYLHERRRQLNGYLPTRRMKSTPVRKIDSTLFDEFLKGTEDREVSTTMVFVRLLTKLLRDKEIGKLVVPIVPDEARTFGMEALFRQVGIYSHVGQLYDPVDKESLLYYKEAKNGQIFEEGITEAGSMSSFIAAGTAYSNYGINTIPFFIYYSMFGLQRVGDLAWAAADMRTRGFLIGGTSGRTTLAGEGLQHQDGNSHLLAYPIPTLKAYDPAYAYELAVIIEDGLRRMYVDQEDVFYYLTVMNENYPQPQMPAGKHIKEGILKGMYKLRSSKLKSPKGRAQLMGSGAILNKVLGAADMLEKEYKIACDVWSVTSYKELHRDALLTERENLFNPSAAPKLPYVAQAFKDSKGVFVAASDYVKALPDSISRWIPGPFFSLGTDGFGRSDGRRHLRDFFEVDERYITLATLNLLTREGTVTPAAVKKAIKKMDIDPDKMNPMTS